MNPTRSTLSFFFLAAGLALSATACSSSKGQLPSDLERGSAGKADGSDAIEWEEVDNFLYSASLRQLICSEVRKSYSTLDCDDLSYDVTAVGRSTLIQYTEDQRPVTVALQVEGVHAPTGSTYQAILRRQITGDFGLGFTADVSTELADAIEYIHDLADEGGEFPPLWDWADEGRIRVISLDDLDPDLRAVFEAARDQQDEFNHGFSEENRGSAEFNEEWPVSEILLDGEVVGYIVVIDDIIDHPLWDGSGATYYYDITGQELTVRTWEG